MVAASCGDEGKAFSVLEELLAKEEYDKAFKTSTQLPLSLKQTEALVFSALQTGRLRQQQQQKESSGEDSAAAHTPPPLALEEAYCLYRLNKPQKALQLLAELQRQPQTHNAMALTHLHAQVALKIGVNRCLGLLRSGRVSLAPLSAGKRGRGRGEDGLRHSKRRGRQAALLHRLCALCMLQIEDCRRLTVSLTSRFGGCASLQRIKAAVQLCACRFHKAEETLRDLLTSPSLELPENAPQRLQLQSFNNRQETSKVPLHPWISSAEPWRIRRASCAASAAATSSSCAVAALRGAAPCAFAAATSIAVALQRFRAVLRLLHWLGVAAARCGSASTAAYVELSLTAAALAASLSRWEVAAAQSETALQRLQQQPHGEAVGAAELRATLSLTEALTRTDLSKAEVNVQRLMRYLPQSVNLIDGEEVEMRRLPPTTRGRRCPLATPGEAAQEGAGSHLAERRKRKKKIRYPKGWDPSKPQLPPDPERWKPKHERYNIALHASFSCSPASETENVQGSAGREGERHREKHPERGGGAGRQALASSSTCLWWLAVISEFHIVTGADTRRCSEEERSVDGEARKAPLHQEQQKQLLASEKPVLRPPKPKRRQMAAQQELKHVGRVGGVDAKASVFLPEIYLSDPAKED
ncbi:hypothetical protein cyc_05348 [Cyclospora cayetanensis]|uniref:Signal recognition particle subunit SRP72 n=1 Tax=Cyclospora cayetanensis TaxID=88456 RepID=A0A1D3CVG1_9EIME|nr:hypothetical protein cyc_05348 [Cyclospora cayetanensis]